MRRMNFTKPRGVASVLAMLFLVLFSTLAVGFYATVTTATSVAANERKINQAQLAAESGMQWITHQLWTLDIPGNTPASSLLDEVYDQLHDRMEGTTNLDSGHVGYTSAVISIPADAAQFIPLDAQGSRFRASIARDGSRLTVTVVGAGDGQITRAISLQYDIAQRASAIFDYGVASRSPIVMIGNTSIKGKSNPAQGSVLSTSPRAPMITLTGNSEISGDISLTASVSASSGLDIAGNCKVGGYVPSSSGFNDHVHLGVIEPEFPVIDTAAFEPYATNLITRSPSGGNKSYTNLRIKANANPTFSGNTTVSGVIYIETPNRVTFNGNLTLTGVIVVENNPKGDASTNLIDFGGNVTFKGVDQLPSTFGGLRDLRYAMLLAPKFKLKMRGNFGTIAGTIAASEMEFSGNAGGTIKGSVINLEDTNVSLNGNTNIVIESQGSGAMPAGMSFGKRYVPLPDSYAEVIP